MEPRPQHARPGHLVHLNRSVQALDRHRAQGLDLHITFDQPQRVGSQECAAGSCQLLHPGGQVGRLTHGRVVHVEVAPDRAHHHFTRVQSDSNVERETVRSANLLRIASDGGLHVERGVARPYRVSMIVGNSGILVCVEKLARDLLA